MSHVSLVLALHFFFPDSLGCEHRQVPNRAPSNNGTRRRVGVVEFEFYTADEGYFRYEESARGPHLERDCGHA